MCTYLPGYPMLQKLTPDLLALSKSKTGSTSPTKAAHLEAPEAFAAEDGGSHGVGAVAAHVGDDRVEAARRQVRLEPLDQLVHHLRRRLPILCT